MTASKDRGKVSSRARLAVFVSAVLLAAAGVFGVLWLLRGDASAPPGAAAAPETTSAKPPAGADLIEDCARRRDWERLLAYARTMPPEQYSVEVMHEVQRALYHSGRLLDEMFSYPQTVKRDGRLIFSGLTTRNAVTAWKRAVTLFELGHVNLAESCAHLTLDADGPPGDYLPLMSKIYVLKEQPVMARTCLHALAARDPSQRTWAEAQLTLLADDPLLRRDPEISRLRSMMPTRDYCRGPGAPLSFRVHLLQLLDTNPANRMAFEYLVAFDLWSIRPDLVTTDLRFWRSAGAARLPRHCQEAVLVFLSDPRFQKPEYAQVKALAQTFASSIDESTVARIRDYGQQTEKLGATPEEARPAVLADMEKTFGSSYFFYCTFGYSAAGRQVRPVDAVTGASP